MKLLICILVIICRWLEHQLKRALAGIRLELILFMKKLGDVQKCILASSMMLTDVRYLNFVVLLVVLPQVKYFTSQYHYRNLLEIQPLAYTLILSLFHLVIKKEIG